MFRLEEKERAFLECNSSFSSISANKSAEKCSSIAVYEAQKIQDLELLVSKYKADMQRVLDHSEIPTESLATIEKVQEENERLRDESIEIRALLATTLNAK
uniref:Uncharacterized protein n=1 Tax=Ditylenchus dipsaci TaxID=166011 RepID=A0A915EJH2_9BILA